MDQNDLNKTMGEALKGFMDVVQAQQRQLISLHKIVEHHQKIFAIVANTESQTQEVREEVIREETSRAAAEIAELKRLHDLNAGDEKR